jgi:hypothetical protein
MESQITFCLLAEIKNKRSNIKSLIEIFQELVETLFSINYPDGEISGRIEDLRNDFIIVYSIEIPFPTLKIILSNIKCKYGEKFQLYQDFSFIVDKNTFPDHHDEVQKSERDIDDLKHLYDQYCKINNTGVHYEDLFAFIAQSKKQLIEYINNPNELLQASWNQTVIDFVSLINGIPRYKNIFEKLIMGSVISSYFDICIDNDPVKKRLVLDTNFIVSLMNLHSEESYSSTEMILELSNKAGYVVEVLPETIKETQNLLERKSREIDRITIFSSQRPHTIEAGCARRKITGQVLSVQKDRLEYFLLNRGVKIISNEQNNKLLHNVESTEIYKKLKDRPFNKDGVIHDAIAMNYIKEIRNKDARNFNEIDAFFVTDTSGFLENKVTISTKLPYIIRAEELLNILWLSNPIMDSTILTSNVSRMLTVFLDKKLPNKEMLSRIDEKIENLQDYDLDEEACVNLAINIAEVDTRKLTELINTEEKEVIKEKIYELASMAIKSRKEEEEKRNKEFGELLVYLEEENKIEKKEAMDAREKDLNVMNLLYDERMRNKEKEHNDELMARDKEAIENIDNDIAMLNEQVEKNSHGIFSLAIILGLAGLAFIVIYKIIPFWQIYEPIVWAVGLLPCFIYGIMYVIVGHTIKPDEAIKNIKRLFNKDLFERLAKKEKEKENVLKRYNQLVEKDKYSIR